MFVRIFPIGNFPYRLSAPDQYPRADCPEYGSFIRTDSRWCLLLRDRKPIAKRYSACPAACDGRRFNAASGGGICRRKSTSMMVAAPLAINKVTQRLVNRTLFASSG